MDRSKNLTQRIRAILPSWAVVIIRPFYILINKSFLSLLSFINEKRFRKLIQTITALDQSAASKNKKKYVIITFFSYPYGGAEEYFIQTMKQATEKNYQSIWISFQDKYSQVYKKTIVESNEFGIFVKIAAGFQKVKIIKLLEILQPDVVHTYGLKSDIICQITLGLRIPTILGYHFWNRLIQLGKTGNTDIIKNIKNHSVDSTYIELKNKGISQYVVSDFMNQVISALNYPCIDSVIYPITDSSFFKINDYDPQSKYITMVNIHEEKGGKIILKLIEELDLPFLVIQTQPNSDILNNQIRQAIEKNKQSVYLTHQTNMKAIYASSRLILIPTLMDETFCRVAYEAAANGIPLLTTGKGFIKEMINFPELIVSSNNWREKVVELYYDDKKRLEISKRLKTEVSRFEKSKDRLMDFVNNLSARNIMIFTPWADQGLGIQSRTYAKILMANGYKVSIFAYLPYNCVDKDISLQQNPSEWQDYNNIYYSFNTREKVTDQEITQFVHKFKIQKCLIPEICFSRIFEISRLLKKLNVKVYAIPNIEIIRKKEIKKFRYFHKILAPAYILIDKLQRYNFNISYIGHGVPDHTVEKVVKDEINFLHISGLNSLQRKQTLKIIDAFNIASTKNPKINLTITIQGNIPLEIYEKSRNNPKIKLIDKHLSHNEIIDLYQKSHISIQVSSHEGIGLGFYESISCGTPVISLNTPPHNEVIKENITGWLIDCEYSSLTDNPDALVKYAYFKVNNLSDKIVEVSNNISQINETIKSTITYFKENCSDQILFDRLEKF